MPSNVLFVATRLAASVCIGQFTGWWLVIFGTNFFPKYGCPFVFGSISADIIIRAITEFLLFNGLIADNSMFTD
jgi:hypothetical protein